MPACMPVRAPTCAALCPALGLRVLLTGGLHSRTGPPGRAAAHLGQGLASARVQRGSQRRAPPVAGRARVGVLGSDLHGRGARLAGGSAQRAG